LAIKELTMYKYSATTKSFYQIDFLSSYSNLPTDLIDADEATFQSCVNRPQGATLSVVSGVVTVIPAPAQTAEELFAQTEATYTQAVQSFIISIAQKKGYRDDVSCASYFNDPHQPFASEAQAFVPWRSSVWLQCYTDLAAIQAGTMVMPTSPEAYILTLPVVPSGF
jgi:hypothetical protein